MTLKFSVCSCPGDPAFVNLFYRSEKISVETKVQMNFLTLACFVGVCGQNEKEESERGEGGRGDEKGEKRRKITGGKKK